jgi:hypothetical protein
MVGLCPCDVIDFYDTSHWLLKLVYIMKVFMVLKYCMGRAIVDHADSLLV